MKKVDGTLKRLLDVVLPPRCLLCGAHAEPGHGLCAACHADMPRNDCCCQRCALPLEHPAAECGICLRREPPFARAWAPFRYAHPLDLLEARFKFRRDLAAGKALSGLMIEAAHGDLRAELPERIYCVPLHPDRLRERGYNQSLELAKPLARALEIPLDFSSLVRSRSTLAQTGLDARERRRNLRGAFELSSGAELPGHAAILDDVMTTGTTLRECAQVLRKAGVARVDVWALARAPARR
ncbi:ComF family protein [Dokdonella sp.]|uniref:ComF family protein n=1 Tax=Dokdonella sp. TaxID=2291710 RepID=UPI003C352F6B